MEPHTGSARTVVTPSISGVVTTSTSGGEVTISAALRVNDHLLSRRERLVAHGALLAQVDDVHAGGVNGWTESDHEAALALLSALTGQKVGADPSEAPSSYGEGVSSRVLVLALLVPIYDLDHPDMTPEEWAEAERLLGLLSEEFGR